MKSLSSIICARDGHLFGYVTVKDNSLQKKVGLTLKLPDKLLLTLYIDREGGDNK